MGPLPAPQGINGAYLCAGVRRFGVCTNLCRKWTGPAHCAHCLPIVHTFGTLYTPNDNSEDQVATASGFLDVEVSKQPLLDKCVPFVKGVKRSFEWSIQIHANLP